MFGLLALYGISYRCGMVLSGVYEPLESRFHRLALTRFERFNRGFICRRQMRTDPGETKVTETQCRCEFDISISAVSKGSTSSDLCCFILFDKISSWGSGNSCYGRSGNLSLHVYTTIMYTRL